MAPANGTDTMRKALAMGAQRGVLVTDPALEGADMPATIRVLAAAAAAEEFDLLLAGLDTSDGQGGAVAAGVAARLGLPLLSTAAADRARSGRRPRPRASAVRQGLRRHRGADAGGHLVHPGARRAALPVPQGDHGRPLARDRAAARVAELGDARRARRWRRWSTRVVGRGRRRRRVPRAASCSGPPDEAAREIADFLAARRLI